MNMDIKRIVTHLLCTDWRIRRVFPQQSLLAIEQAIAASERMHGGEIRFVVEGGLDSASLFSDLSARDRAIEVFSHLRVWDTEHNNGVLIYLLLADRDVEIVVDRGLHARVGAAEWERICGEMEAAFRQGHFEAGVVAGIAAVTLHLVKHFPAGSDAGNELPDQPVVL